MDNQQEILNDFWKYWFFGIFDGDGCFNFNVQKRLKNKVHCTPRIILTNTEIRIIDAVVNNILKKLKLAYYLQTRSSGKWQPRYDVEVAGLKRVNRFCNAVGEYGGIRTKEFEIMRKYVNTRMNKHQNSPLDDEDFGNIEMLKNCRGFEGGILFDRIDEKSLSWLGGIFDAEGTFGIRKAKDSKDYFYYEARIQISNTVESIVDSVKNLLDLLNIHTYLHTHHPKKKKHKTKHMLQIVGKDSCQQFLNVIGNYIVGKHTHVEIMKEFVDLPTSRKGIIYKELSRMCFEKMYLLNHREIPRGHTSDAHLGNDMVQPI